MNTIVGNNKQRSADRVYTVLTTYRCVSGAQECSKPSFVAPIWSRPYRVKQDSPDVGGRSSGTLLEHLWCCVSNVHCWLILLLQQALPNEPGCTHVKKLQGILITTHLY